MTEADDVLKNLIDQIAQKIEAYKSFSDSLIHEVKLRDKQISKQKEEIKLLKIRIKNLLKKGK